MQYVPSSVCLTSASTPYCAQSWYTSLEMVERGVLWHAAVGHAQARVCSVDMKYNHVYYTTLHNQEIRNVRGPCKTT